MAIFLPLHDNYDLHFQENQIYNIAEEQGIYDFQEYDNQVLTTYIISYVTTLFFSTFILCAIQQTLIFSSYFYLFLFF